MRTKKLTAVLLALLTLALVATSCRTPTAEPTATTAPAAEPTEAPAAEGLPDLGGREIRAVTTADLPPYNFLDDDGNLTGWEIELVEMICELVNCELTWAISSFDGLIPGLAAGDYDIAASDLFIRPDRAEIVDFTPPYLVSGEVVVVRADEDRVQSYQDLEGLDDVLVGAEGGTSCEEAAREVANVPDERMRIYESIDVAFLALLNEDVDAIVDGSISALAYIDIHAPALKIVGGGAEESLFTKGESAIAVRQDEPEMLEAFSVAVQTFVDDGTMDSLLDKWDVPRWKPTEVPAAEALPDLGGREIRAVTTADLPPYNFLDDDGNLTGWEIELVEMICELVNCELTWAISSFDGLIPGLAAGDYDIAASDLFIRPDRAEIVDFTPPYLVSGEVVVVRADEDRVQSYQDLEGLDDVLVGAEGGTSCEEAAREVANVPDERMRIYESIDVAFLALLNEDVDAIVDGSISALAYIDIHAPALKIVGGGAEESLFTKGESAIAVRQDEPEMLEAFSVAVQTFVDDGTMDSLLDKWDVPRWKPTD